MTTLKPSTVRRWTPGRVGSDVAILMVAVPLGLNILEPQIRGECATTLDHFVLAAGIWFLIMRMVWIVLKAGNNAMERWLASPSSTKPQPLDDF